MTVRTVSLNSSAQTQRASAAAPTSTSASNEPTARLIATLRTIVSKGTLSLGSVPARGPGEGREIDLIKRDFEDACMSQTDPRKVDDLVAMVTAAINATEPGTWFTNIFTGVTNWSPADAATRDQLIRDMENVANQHKSKLLNAQAFEKLTAGFSEFSEA